MPGSVSNASASTVMPQTLCAAFIESREWSVEINEYVDGSSQRTARTATSRKRFQIGKRLNATQLLALRDFWDARKGPMEAFYFYSPYDATLGSAIGSNYDASGVGTTGRYLVHFVGEWSQAMGMVRGEVSVELEELA